MTALARVVDFRRRRSRRLEASLDPRAAQIVAAYEKRLEKILRSSEIRTEADLRKVAKLFREFRAQALAAIPQRYALNRAAASGVLMSVAERLDALSAELRGLVAEGMQFQAATTQRIAEAYAEVFLPRDTPPIHIATTPEAVAIAQSFSAELIGLREGGLTAKVKAEVNRVVRLGALGAGDTSYNAAAEIAKALNGGAGGAWSWQGERIYRTEVLRVHSLTSQATIDRLNRIRPTRKRWRWSRISRLEHQQVDGQTVPASGSFSVPTRSSGVVSMRYPRDPAAPPDATINCGCSVIPWPSDATLRRAGLAKP